MKYFRSPQLPQIRIKNNTDIQVEYLNVATIAEAQALSADFIDLSYSDYLSLRDQFSISSIDCHSLGAADCLIQINDKYQFYQLSQIVFLKYVAELKISLKSSEVAVFVGDELTIAQFLPALTQFGYSKFIFVVENEKTTTLFVEKIQKTYLGLSVQILNFNQVTQIDSIASFLLVDFDHHLQTELVESLTYFNFLKTGSIFFDVRSLRDQHLVDEAQRAQMFVIDADSFQNNRLSMANQILSKKNK